ncbi:MAG TPA: EndoU domain-containing protein, partial [Saprospiraceae bacterium]|nr:EndoU domain-containing protein [Saprospiraceae bacterium]
FLTQGNTIFPSDILNYTRIKSLDEVFSSVTLPLINMNTLQHVFRGNPIGHPNPMGGFHHISSLLHRTDIEIIDRVQIGQYGCYGAILRFPNGATPPKTFFPDHWDEIKTIQEIEFAFANRTQPQGFPSGHYLGFSREGVPIRIVFSNNKINSAFPELSYP